MHPVEHFFYWAGVVINWIAPSHPVIALFHLLHAALTSSKGHSGFDRTAPADSTELMHGNYFHYLHLENFECNIGGDDGKAPKVKWFGTFNDGTDGSIAEMNARRPV